MALSPIETVVEAFVDNMDYYTTGDVAKAALFINAATELMLRRPELTNIAGNVIRFDSSSLQSQLTDAKKWYSANKPSTGSGSNTRYYDTSQVRG